MLNGLLVYIITIDYYSKVSDSQPQYGQPGYFGIGILWVIVFCNSFQVFIGHSLPKEPVSFQEGNTLKLQNHMNWHTPCAKSTVTSDDKFILILWIAPSEHF